jgi:hypothetical protein
MEMISIAINPGLSLDNNRLWGDGKNYSEKIPRFVASGPTRFTN